MGKTIQTIKECKHKKSIFMKCCGTYYCPDCKTTSGVPQSPQPDTNITECKCSCHQGYLSTNQPMGDHLKECYEVYHQDVTLSKDREDWEKEFWDLIWKLGINFNGAGNIEKVKSFIRQQISLQREQIKEKIEIYDSIICKTPKQTKAFAKHILSELSEEKNG